MGRSADVPRAAGEIGGDDSGCTVLHVDMDAFYASVEVRRRPELRGRPVVVGGAHRGVVAAASYEARRFGIRSAMPMTRALRLCPGAVVLPPDRAAYSEASAAVMAILRDVTPCVEPLSLDEAFLDVSTVVRIGGRPAVIAAGIRQRVSAELGLTCSVGVAPTKFMAKLASARCKPDGLLVVPAADVLRVLHPLPVTVLSGVGARTAQELARLGVRTVADLAGTPLPTLVRAVGPSTAQHLHDLALGRDPREVHAEDMEKSVSADRTVDSDLTDVAEVRRELLRHAGDVAQRLRSRRLGARTVGIKIRYADFRTVTRVRTLPGWVDDTATIYAAACQLYDSLRLDRPRIRLVGVKAENLRDAERVAEQLTLDAALPAARTHNDSAVPGRAERAVAAARTRFGSGAVDYASLLPAPGRAEAADNFRSGESARMLEGGGAHAGGAMKEA
jgi:DNA polymerase IV